MGECVQAPIARRFAPNVCSALAPPGACSQATLMISFGIQPNCLVSLLETKVPIAFSFPRDKSILISCKWRLMPCREVIHFEPSRSEVFPSILKITQDTYRGNPKRLSDRALGERQVTSIFWVILKMANGAELAIDAKTFIIQLS